MKFSRLFLPVTAACLVFLGSTAKAANTVDIVTGTAPNTPLDSPSSYTLGTPGTTSDVVFAGGSPYSGTFTLTTSPLSIGTLNDLSSIALTINASQTITLNTAANSVSGTAADLLYVIGLGSLTINDSSSLVFANSGSVDDGGTLNLGTTPISITAAKTVTFTGPGTTTVGGVIAATTGLVTVNDAGGTVYFSNTDLYTGATTVNGGTLDLSTFTGSVASSAITVNAGGTLVIDSSSGTPVSSVTRGASLSLAGGAIVDKGTTLGNTDDIITGAMTVTGMNIPATVTVTPGAGKSAELSAASLAHTTNGTALVNGTNLGAATVGTAGDGNIIFTTAPTTLFVGSTSQTTGGISAGTDTTAILPFLVGEATQTTGGLGTQTGTANTFVTYDATTGLRPLNPTDEFKNNATVAGDNTYITTATTGTAATSINSLVINGGNLTVTGTLTDASGALLIASSNNITGGTSLATTANSLNIYVDANVTSTISTPVVVNPTGGSAAVFDLSSGSTLTMTGGMSNATSASSGPWVINGPGTLTLNGGAYSASVSGYTGNLYVDGGATLNMMGGTSITAYTDLHSAYGTVTDINTNSAIAVAELLNTGTGGTVKLTRSGLSLLNGTGTNFGGTITGGAVLTISNGFGNNETDTLTGVNNYAGGTFLTAIDTSIDTLKLSGGNALSDTGLVTLGAATGANSAILDLNGSSETIGSLATSATQANTLGTINLTNSGAASTLTINTAVAGNATFNGVLKATTSGNLSLVKKGINTETLGATNLYTGTTTVNNGTLALDFSQFASSQTNSPFDILAFNNVLTLGGGTFSVIGNPDGAATSAGSWTGSLTSQILTFASGVPTGLTVGQAVSGTGIAGGAYIVSINTAAKTIAISADPSTTSGSDFASTAIAMNSFQGLGNLTLTAGTGNGIVVNGSTGSGGTQLQLGNTWNRGAGSTLAITLTGDTPQLTASPTLTANNILGGWATVTDSGGTGFATVLGGNVVRYTGATVGLPTSGSSINTDYSTSGPVNLAASEGVNSLALDTSSMAGNLNLGGDILTIGSGGLLMTGSSSAIIINGQLVSGTGEVIVQQFGTGTLTIAGSINTGSLTKAGPGTLILNGPNNYTGGTNLNGGILNFTTSANLGSGAITFGGGTLQYATGNTYDITASTVTLAGAGGTIDTNNNIVTFANAISGTGGLAKAGSGVLTITGLNTYTGDTTVQGGLLQLNLINNTTGVINSGSALIGQGGALAILGNPSVASSQTLGGLNVFSGGTGIMLYSAGSALTLTINNTWARTAGATVNFNLASSASNVLQSATVSNNADGIIGGWATITTTTGTSFATYSDSPSVVTNPIIALTGQGALPTATGAAASNYALAASENLTAAVAANTVAVNTTAAPVTLGLGTFNLNLGTAAIPGALLVTGTNASSITGTGELGTTGSEVIINQYATAGPTGALTVATPISGGAGSLTTSGPGTVIVTGNSNVYTGKTSIDGGVFLADNSTSSASATGTGAVNVANGATLGGSGFITPSGVTSSSASTVAVNIGAGAVLSPSNGTNGNGSGGSVSYASHLTFALNSGTSVNVATPGTTTVNLVFDLGTNSDEVFINNGGANELTMNGEQFSNFTFNQETGFGAGTYTLVQTDNTSGISSNALGALVTGTIGSYNATLQVNTIGSNEDLQLVVVAAIPEPSIWSMLLLGLPGLAVFFWRRRESIFHAPVQD